MPIQAISLVSWHLPCYTQAQTCLKRALFWQEKALYQTFVDATFQKQRQQQGRTNEANVDIRGVTRAFYPSAR